jgi:hypothetical protein
VKIPIIVAVAILSLTLAGCAANSQAVTVGDAAKSTVSAAPVEQGAKGVLSTKVATASLPTAAQLGTTWVDGKASTDTDDSDDSTSADPTIAPASCAFISTDAGLSKVQVVPKSDKPVAEAKADYHVKSASDDDSFSLDLDTASVTIDSYKDDVDSSKLAGIATELKKCAKFTSTDSSSGLTATFQIFPESLPNYADGTLAFRVQGQVSFVTALIDEVNIVSGHNLITITQSGIGSIDTKMAQASAKAVMANLAAQTK